MDNGQSKHKERNYCKPVKVSTIFFSKWGKKCLIKKVHYTLIEQNIYNRKEKLNYSSKFELSSESCTWSTKLLIKEIFFLYSVNSSCNLVALLLN